MKKLALLLTVLTLAFPAQAVEIGDIYYSNKSFSSTPVDGLLPIGIVWQVNDAGNGGLIVALEQPGSKNWERAKTYCRLYLTRGTKAGDWFMPDFLQMFPIDKMQNRRINARTFLHINDRLALVKEARALKEDVYMTSSDYADDKKAAIGINLTTGLFQSSNMNEYIFISAFRLNKSISFFGIEPLYCTFHVLFLIKKLIVITIHVALTA